MNALSPRKIPASSGNEFYVLLSLAIFKCHDLHEAIRQKIWNGFCFSVFGIGLEDLYVHVMDNTLERIRLKEGYQSADGVNEWMSTLNQARLGERGYVKSSAIEFLRIHMFTGTSPPKMEIICPLVCREYGVAIVFYRALEENVRDYIEPMQTWYPKVITPTCKHIHVLEEEETGNFYLLVIPSKSQAIPTKVMGRLNGGIVSVKTAFDLNIRAVYRLWGFDPEKKVSHELAPFIPPDMNNDTKEPGTCHTLRIDARYIDKRYVLVIKGCLDKKEPFAIFSVTEAGGKNHATHIGFWPVDFTEPRIRITEKDDWLVIVPANSIEEAIRIIRVERHCLVIDPQKK